MYSKDFFRRLQMNRPKFFSLLFVLMVPLLVKGQLADNLYLIDETTVSGVDIVQVDDKKVKYKDQKGKELAYHTKYVLLAFNAEGNFLSFPATEDQLQDFSKKRNDRSGSDLIVTINKQLISAHIQEEDEFEVTYQGREADGSSKLSTTEVAVILYKDGRHKLFTSPSQVAHLLSTLREQVEAKRLEPFPLKEEEPAVLLASNSEVKEVLKQEKDLAPPPDALSSSTLAIDFDVYQKKALQKTADLGTYLGIVSDRTSDLGKADKAVELALRLFVDEYAQVEVSSKTGKTNYNIRTYLNRLKLLKYDKIDISWSDISYVSELKKGSDGNYYGIITLQQRFNGFIDGKLAYSDLTEKNVEVILKAYEKETDGAKQEMWDVFLSDIGVVVTNFD